MKPAPCSWRVRIILIDFDRDRLSRKSRFSSPGTPKIYSTPSSSRHSMNRSDAFFMRVAPSAAHRHGAAPSHAGDPSALYLLQRRSSRSEEHTSELQSLMRISYAVFCLKKKNNTAIIIS